MPCAEKESASNSGLIRSPCFWIGLFLFLLTLGIRTGSVFEYENRVGIDDFAFKESEAEAVAHWARDLAAGDWLLESPPHPYPDWARQIAPQSQWLEWAGGNRAYPFSPLYPTIVGVLYRLFGENPLAVRFFQALLGACTALFIFLIARHYFGRITGAAAALLFSFCGFQFFFDNLFMREGLVTFLTCAFLYRIIRAARSKRWFDFLWAALILGLCITATSGALVLVPILFLAAHGAQGKGPLTRRGLHLAGLVLFLGMPILPFLARNAILDSPTMQLSASGPVAFVSGNLRYPQGVTWPPPARQTRRLFMEGNGRLGPIISGTLKTWISHPLDYGQRLCGKTAALFQDRPITDPLDRALVVELTSVSSRLGFVSYGLLAAGALLGMLLLLPRASRIWPLYLVIILITVTLILFHGPPGMQQPLVPFYAIFAGFALIWLVKKIVKRRWFAVVPVGLLLLLLASWTGRETSPARADCLLEKSYLDAIWMLVAQHKIDRAMALKDRLIHVSEERAEDCFYPQQTESIQATNRAFQAFAEAMQADHSESDHSESDHSESDRQFHMARGYLEMQAALPNKHILACLQAARDAVEKTLELDPSYAGASRLLGITLKDQALRRRKDVDRVQGLALAAAKFKDALALDPDDPEAIKGLGFCYEKLGNIEEALSSYRRCLLLSEPWDYELGSRVAWIQLNQPDLDSDELEQVLVMTQAAYQHNPDDLRYCRDLSTALYRARRITEAIDIVEHMKALDPRSMMEYNTRIENFRKRGLRDEETPEETVEGVEAIEL